MGILRIPVFIIYLLLCGLKPQESTLSCTRPFYLSVEHGGGAREVLGCRHQLQRSFMYAFTLLS
jgi:hypothetical protein